MGCFTTRRPLNSYLWTRGLGTKRGMANMKFMQSVILVSVVCLFCGGANALSNMAAEKAQFCNTEDANDVCQLWTTYSGDELVYEESCGSYCYRWKIVTNCNRPHDTESINASFSYV